MRQLLDILFIASNDWDGLWYQRQEYALRFAQAGHRVFYFNKTPQRMPQIRHFKQCLYRLRGRTKKSNPRHKNLTVVTPYWLVPLESLRRLNRILIRRTFNCLDLRSPILITDVPSYNVIDVIDFLRPCKVVYVDVHNYDDNEWVVKQIHDSEELLINRAHFLFGTSRYNQKRLERISGRVDIYRSPPGVDYKLFKSAFRGDEFVRCKTIYFYGTVQGAVDIELFNKLSHDFSIVFIGDVTDDARAVMSARIEVRPAVPVAELARQLKDADILGLFYKQTAFNRGVIPAKIYECLATGKPVLACGLDEKNLPEGGVYHFDGSYEDAMQLINNLGATETPVRIDSRDLIAQEADWSQRFKKFSETIFSAEESDIKKRLPGFSVLMSVYAGDNADDLAEAIESLFNQTAEPDEVVIVVDGPVGGEIEAVIEKTQNDRGGICKVHRFAKNMGLGIALAAGVEICSHDIIARMDADDISDSRRFEKQLAFLQANEDIDVVSSWLAAFEKERNQVLFYKKGPCSHDGISSLSRFRFCMNHPASVFRKKAILKAGNYQPFAGLEDYHLWARMLLNGSRMANIPEVLYYHRWERRLLLRRSGITRAFQQVRLQREFLRMGFINHRQFVRNVVVRGLAAVLPLGLMRTVRMLLGI